ncbi:MAG TPA: phosphatase PAP2 family protein, partial [Candidatus Thermoplasmatota archaeon]|nr:phosphatase PAP2 family protein [Candidatus Thermoplasmatota archaeon]
LRASLLDINFLYFLMGVVSVGGLSLAAAAMVRGGRLDPDSGVARHVARMRGALPAVVVLSVTTIVAGVQGGLERTVQTALGWDFTPHVHALEGDLVARVQAAIRNPILDVVLVSVYTAGAFLLYFVPFFALVALGRGRSAMRVACTVAGIWAVGVVCYFFLPVKEVWYSGLGGAQPILFEYFPEYDHSPTYMNSIDNNVPSLHTALSCGIALALWLARERWLAIPATAVAAGITMATMYLGIHWVTDVATGLLTMGAAAWLAHRRLPREERPFTPFAWVRAKLRRKRIGDVAEA